MAQQNNQLVRKVARMKDNNGVYSQRLRAGKRRTYFFDVRTTKSDDYYITITESKKKFNQDGYDRHKIFLYKEDFNKFVSALENTVNHVKEELMPDYNFDEFNRELEEFNHTKNNYSVPSETKTAEQFLNQREPVITEPTLPEINYSDSEEDLSF